jgi:GT2 family glycosyltransferase
VDTRELDHRGVRFDLLKRPFHDQTPNPRHARRDYSPYPAVTAACCAIHRRTFLDADGFDEAYRNGYEDIDLCLRLAHRGLRHYVANRSIVRHHVSISPGRFARESANLSLFLSRWGWPPPGPPPRVRGLNYLGRHWRRPWRYNGSKLIVALALLITGRPCAALEKRLGVEVGVKLRP